MGMAAGHRLPVKVNGERSLGNGRASGAVPIAREQASEQALSGLDLPDVTRLDSGGGDDLRIRIDRDVPFLSVEPAGVC
jgi:hypothetical protein